MSLLARVTETLDSGGIRYALIGALALSAHGVNRATVDLDLFTVDASCLSPDFWADLQSRGVDSDVRKGDLTDPLAGVVRFQAEGENFVDLVVGKFAWQRKIVERAASIGETEIPIVRAADLILLKLYAGGPQDAWDVEQLLTGPSREELIREVESRLVDLPRESSELWSRIVL